MNPQQTNTAHSLYALYETLPEKAVKAIYQVNEQLFHKPRLGDHEGEALASKTRLLNQSLETSQYI